MNRAAMGATDARHAKPAKGPMPPEARVNAETERAYFADPKNVATFAAQRKTNRMDEKFCWKS
jgi:hypothetical protein